MFDKQVNIQKAGDRFARMVFALELHTGEFCMLLLMSADIFSKSFLKINCFKNTIRVSNSVDPV